MWLPHEVRRDNLLHHLVRSVIQFLFIAMKFRQFGSHHPLPIVLIHVTFPSPSGFKRAGQGISRMPKLLIGRDDIVHVFIIEKTSIRDAFRSRFHIPAVHAIFIPKFNAVPQISSPHLDKEWKAFRLVHHAVGNARIHFYPMTLKRLHKRIPRLIPREPLQWHMERPVDERRIHFSEMRNHPWRSAHNKKERGIPPNVLFKVKQGFRNLRFDHMRLIDQHNRRFVPTPANQQLRSLINGGWFPHIVTAGEKALEPHRDLIRPVRIAQPASSHLLY